MPWEMEKEEEMQREREIWREEKNKTRKKTINNGLPVFFPPKIKAIIELNAGWRDKGLGARVQERAPV